MMNKVLTWVRQFLCPHGYTQSSIRYTWVCVLCGKEVPEEKW